MQSRLVTPSRRLAVPTGAMRAVPSSELDVPELIRTTVGFYKKAKWTGVNESGIRAIGDRVLVLVDEAATKSAGGVAFTENSQDSQGKAAETGVLVHLGDAAFALNFDRTGPFVGEKPEAGQRVYFERYAGGEFVGRDGRTYRLMDDKCLGGLEA